MGLLSNLVNSKLGKALDVTTVAFVHPVKTISAAISPTKTVKEVVKEHFAQPLGKQLTETVLTTAGYATAVVGAGAVSGAAKAGTLGTKAASVAKSLIPTTTKGKIIGAIAAPVVVGAVINQPAKAAKVVTGAPSALANVGGNIANLAANPSIENVKNLVTENPVLVGGAAAVAAIAGAKTLIPAITTSRQIEATQEQTEAIKEATAGISVVDKSGQFAATAPQTPTMPATQEISNAKPLARRKKRSSVAVMPSVRQNVSVIVQNKASSTGIRATKRYLNKEVLSF